MRGPSELTRVHLAMGVAGVLLIAGAASWAGDGLSDGHGNLSPAAATVAAPHALPGSTNPAAGATGPNGFVRATINNVEACARWSPGSSAKSASGAVTLDCDARDLALVDLSTDGGACGRFVAQDRIYPTRSCEVAEGSIVHADHDGAPWMIGRCTCRDITVTFEVPVR